MRVARMILLVGVWQTVLVCGFERDCFRVWESLFGLVEANLLQS